MTVYFLFIHHSEPSLGPHGQRMHPVMSVPQKLVQFKSHSVFYVHYLHEPKDEAGMVTLFCDSRKVYVSMKMMKSLVKDLPFPLVSLGIQCCHGIL